MEIVDKRIWLETAKLAKEKGYDIAANGCYTEYLVTKIDPEYPEGGGPFGMTKGEIVLSADYFANNWEQTDYSNENYFMCAAHTQTLLAAWLRVKHNIQVYACSQTIDGNGKYRDYVAHVNNLEINDARDEEYQTYEEAMEVGLQHALGLIKSA